MQPIRPDWNSNVGLPATPFFCKTSVRCLVPLVIAIGAISIALHRNLRPLVQRSLVAVWILGINVAGLALGFPSKLEQSSLMLKRRTVGAMIDYGNFGLVTIAFRFPEALRLGVITSQDCERIVSNDLVHNQFDMLDRRHNLAANFERFSPALVSTLQKKYLEWQFANAQTVKEISDTPFAKKAGITPQVVVSQYSLENLTDNDCPQIKPPLAVNILANSWL